MSSIRSIQEFGAALIKMRDLDPVYVGLVGAGLPEDQLKRWLLAYWCFYHAGAASWLSEQEKSRYWIWMAIAAENREGAADLAGGKLPLKEDRWPRATERRHFRGEKCVDAVRSLTLRSPGRPEKLVDDLVAGGDLTDAVVMQRVQLWPLFGPWIAFKAADMLERCLGVRVLFDPNLGLMYREPRAGIDLALTELDAPMSAEDFYRGLLYWFAGFGPAPPAGTRPVGPQEVETILCKWKSMRGGHYWVGKDVREVRAALAGWGETADRVLAAMPAEVERVVA